MSRHGRDGVTAGKGEWREWEWGRWREKACGVRTRRQTWRDERELRERRRRLGELWPLTWPDASWEARGLVGSSPVVCGPSGGWLGCETRDCRPLFKTQEEKKQPRTHFKLQGFLKWQTARAAQIKYYTSNRRFNAEYSVYLSCTQTDFELKLKKINQREENASFITSKKKKYVYFYSSRYLKLKQTFQNTVLGVITLSVKDYRLQEDAFLFKQRGAMSWTWTFSEFGSRVQIAGRRETALHCCRYRVKKGCIKTSKIMS